VVDGGEPNQQTPSIQRLTPLMGAIAGDLMLFLDQQVSKLENAALLLDSPVANHTIRAIQIRSLAHVLGGAREFYAYEFQLTPQERVTFKDTLNKDVQLGADSMFVDLAASMEKRRKAKEDKDNKPPTINN
jgi:hypothetical protein